MVNKQVGVTAEEVLLYQFQPKDTLVDIGCGTGVFARNVGYTYSDMQFILEDVHATFLKRADELFHTPTFGSRMKGRYQLLQGRNDSIPLPSAWYGLILCRQTLHEFTKPDKMIREIGRITRPGARLFITEVEPQYAGHRDAECQFLYLSIDHIVKQVTGSGLFTVHEIKRYDIYKHLPNTNPFHILEFRRTAVPAY
jgi:ubiquinone/menaquinone biosynthesis C-methylase UbiE